MLDKLKKLPKAFWTGLSKLPKRALRKRIDLIYKYYEHQLGRPLSIDEKAQIIQQCIESIKWYKEQDSKLNKKLYDYLLSVFEEELKRLEAEMK